MEPVIHEKANTDEVTIWVCITTFALYFIQVIPTSIFNSLYPILYSIRGYTENDLSIMALGSIAWSLKFIWGYLFDSLWRPPRWVLAVLQVLLGTISVIITWIPIENVSASAGMYILHTFITVAHDVIFDGQLIMVFSSHGALLNFIQRFAYYATSVVLCFTLVKDFSQYTFLIAGIACILCTPLLWVYKWHSTALLDLKGIWKDIKDKISVIPISFIYFLMESMSGNIMALFSAYIITNNDSLIGYASGTSSIGSMLGISFGQYFYPKLKYRNCIIVAVVIEFLAALMYYFIDPGLTEPQIFSLYFFGGLICSISDSIVQCYKVDAADLTRSPTWTYSVFESFSEAAITIGATVTPQIKEGRSWPSFWGIIMGICGSVFVLALITFYGLPCLRNEVVLNSQPTLDYSQICCCCCQSEQIIANDDENEKEDQNSESSSNKTEQ